MTHEEKMNQLRLIFNECLDVADRKGRDYSGTVDGMGNFRTHGTYGIIVRLHDKMSRLNQLTRPDAKAHVHDESIRDTLKDMINYAGLALIMDDIEGLKKAHAEVMAGLDSRLATYDRDCKRAEEYTALAGRPVTDGLGSVSEF